MATRKLFFFVLALGLFAMAARPVTDPDVWWHLRTGQLILHNRAVFHADPYSFTKAGEQWTDHEWLSQVFIFLVYRAAGYAGLIVTFAALIASAFLIAYWRSPGKPYVTGAVTAWCALASVPCWGVRPQMVTLLLASSLLLILEWSYERPKLLISIPPLMVLWVNLHAGFALGIAFITLYLVGGLLDGAMGFRIPANFSPRRLRHMCLVLACSIAVIPINPYGVRIYSYPFETLHSRAMQGYIGEWMSPNFHDSRYWPTLLVLLAALTFPAISSYRLRPRDLLLLLATAWMALQSVRHIPIFMLIAIPLLSAMIQAWLVDRKVPLAVGKSTSQLPPLKVILNASVLAVSLLFGVIRIRYVIKQQPANEAKEFPSAAIAYIENPRVPGPVMNHYNWGGYFIWKLYPEYKVYIDGRGDLYGDPFIDQFAAAYYLKGKTWDAPFQQWNIQTVFLPPDAPLLTALRSSPVWKTGFADKQAIVLTKVPRMPEKQSFTH